MPVAAVRAALRHAFGRGGLALFRTAVLPAGGTLAPGAARLAAVFARLGQSFGEAAFAQALLVAGIQQHGQHEFAVAALILCRERAHQRDIAGHAQPFQPVELAEAGFQQGGQARTGHGGHVVIRGGGQFAQRDLEMPGNAFQLHALHDVHQRDDRARRPGAARASGAVNVAFVIFRRLIEKDVREGRYVDAARGHVRGHEVLQRAALDLVQHGLAAVLGKIRGQFVGAVAEALQHAGHIVHIGLGIAEDDGRGRILRLQQAHEHAILVHGAAGAEQMLHLGHMHFLAGQGQHGRIGHEFPGQTQHMRRIGGREHAGMHPAAGQIALDFLHVRVEADGQHPVGLVKDQHAQGLEIEGAAQQVVEHPARGAHNELRPVAQGVHLLLVAHAAVNGGGPDAGFGKEGAGLVLHLHGQFPRGHEHKGLRGLCFRIETRQQGQEIGARLAAAGTRLHHDVPPGHEIGQGQGLHGHEVCPAGPGAGGAHGLGQFVEADAGQGVLGFDNGNVFFDEGRHIVVGRGVTIDRAVGGSVEFWHGCLGAGRG